MVPVYAEGDGPELDENGKTSEYCEVEFCLSIALPNIFPNFFFFCIIIFPEPLGVVKNLQVTDPTITTLNVRWDPAEGNVREYKVVYVPAGGGQELTVRGDSCQWGKSYGWSDIAGHSSNFFQAHCSTHAITSRQTQTTQTQHFHAGHA